MSDFITDCINGDALLTEIDDYVDRWHGSKSTLPLHEFLGMTKKEYALFVESDKYLAYIVTARKEGRNIAEIIRSQLSVAARSDSQAKTARIERWLKDQGLWE